MWRPPLPELKAGKADTDCPSEVDYYEVHHTDKVWQKNTNSIQNYNLNCPARKLQLIKRCWAHSVTMRPTFEQVKKMLDKMNPNKVSPVDMMMTLVTAAL